MFSVISLYWGDTCLWQRSGEMGSLRFTGSFCVWLHLVRFTATVASPGSSPCMRGKVGSTLISTGLANPLDEYRSCVHEDNSLERCNGIDGLGSVDNLQVYIRGRVPSADILGG